ncbi:hypothetical protein H4R33_005845 [Dimargaris cristalligena]|nr:hypothetical protein H4R33_005845 [Dimargaris cristalligena]
MADYFETMQQQVAPGDIGSTLRFFQAIQQRIPDHGESDETLDNLITQLMNEADSGSKGAPPASAKFIKQLPTIQVSAIPEGSSCVVCSDQFSATVDDSATRMPCRHIFHKTCLVPWLELHNTCPTCRQEVPSDDPNWLAQKAREENNPEEMQDLMFG